MTFIADDVLRAALERMTDDEVIDLVRVPLKTGAEELRLRVFLRVAPHLAAVLMASCATDAHTLELSHDGRDSEVSGLPGSEGGEGDERQADEGAALGECEKGG